MLHVLGVQLQRSTAPALTGANSLFTDAQLPVHLRKDAERNSNQLLLKGSKKIACH